MFLYAFSPFTAIDPKESAVKLKLFTAYSPPGLAQIKRLSPGRQAAPGSQLMPKSSASFCAREGDCFFC